MLLLLSGEGAADIGQADPGQMGICGPGQWTPGPMAYFADREFEKNFGYSALENELAFFASESLLKQVGEQFKGKPMFMGENNGTLLYRRNAQALGCLARRLSEAYGGQSVLAVLFRDCDGTNTTPKIRWEALLDSISGDRGGFRTMGVVTGVPMIPRPKSEAWLLCAIKNYYQHCSELEELPGNDRSPQGPKKILAATLGYEPTAQQLVLMIGEGRIQPERIDMESFARFQSDFKAACAVEESQWTSEVPQSLLRTCLQVSL